MALSEQSIQALFTSATMALTNGRNDSEINQAMAVFGYIEQRYMEGAQLLSTAEQQEQLHKNARSQVFAITKSLGEIYKAAQVAHKKATATIRYAFQDDPIALQILLPATPASRNRAAMLPHIKAFYINLISATQYHSTLAEFKLPLSELEAGRELIIQADELFTAQRHQQSRATMASAERNKAIAELRQWMSTYLNNAKVSLRHKPALLTAIGYNLLRGPRK